MLLTAARTVTATFTSSTESIITTSGAAPIGQRVAFTATLGISSHDTCIWDFGDATTAPCQPVVARADAAAPHNVTVSAAHIYGRPGQ